MKYSELLAVVILVVAVILLYFNKNKYVVYSLILVAIAIILVGVYDEKAVGSDIKASQTTPLDKTIYSDPTEDRGVVVCAGGGRNLEALAGLKTLRYIEERDKVKPLPIEWYYVGDEEVNPEQRKFIEDYIGDVDFGT